MDSELAGILLVIFAILFMVVLPALVGIYLWISGYVTAVIVEGVIWLFILAIMRDWLREG